MIMMATLVMLRRVQAFEEVDGQDDNIAAVCCGSTVGAGVLTCEVRGT